MKKRERVAEEGQKKEREGERCPELFEQHTRARRGIQLAAGLCMLAYLPPWWKGKGEDRVQEETKASDGILRGKGGRGWKRREEGKEVKRSGEVAGRGKSGRQIEEIRGWKENVRDGGIVGKNRGLAAVVSSPRFLVQSTPQTRSLHPFMIFSKELPILSYLLLSFPVASQRPAVWTAG